MTHDLSVLYHRFPFLGHEFLTWLWFMIENQPDRLPLPSMEVSVQLRTGNRMVLENRGRDGLRETITIRGSEAGLEEALLALRKGALITELHLTATIAELQWQWSLKGESFDFTAMKLPPSAPVQQADEIEGAVIERLHLLDTPFQVVDGLFASFIGLRLSPEWSDKTVPAMIDWVVDHSNFIDTLPTEPA